LPAVRSPGSDPADEQLARGADCLQLVEVARIRRFKRLPSPDIRLRQGKIRARVNIPVDAPLKAALDATPKRSPVPDVAAALRSY